jgi:hypothetical protein
MWAIAMAQRSCDPVLATVSPERRPVLEPHPRRAIEQSAPDLLLLLAGHGGQFSLNAPRHLQLEMTLIVCRGNAPPR